MERAYRLLARGVAIVGTALMMVSASAAATHSGRLAEAEAAGLLGGVAEVAQLSFCLPPKELWQGKCVNKCPAGQFHVAPDGRCQSPLVVSPPNRPCLPPNEVWLGKCVARCPLGTIHTMPDGKCQAINP